jgi:ribosomal protein L33
MTKVSARGHIRVWAANGPTALVPRSPSFRRCYHVSRWLTLSAQKVKSIIIKLVSSAGTGYFYATRKNPTTIQHKLAFMKVSARAHGARRHAHRHRPCAAAISRPTRAASPSLGLQFDPIVRQHVLFTEAKMVKGRGGRRAGK